MCREPVSTAAVSRLIRQILRYSHLHQISHLRFRFLPLFPDAHSDSMVQPSVCLVNSALHACYPIIVQPSPRINLYLFQRWFDTLYSPPGREDFQGFPELLPWLWMNFDEYPTSVPSQCKAEEFKISGCKHAHCTALLSVHRQFQFPFQITDTAFQQPLGCPFAFRKQYEVSRPREPPPKSLSELYVNLSAHTAPIIQPMAVFQTSSVQTDSCHALLFLLTSIRLFFLSFGSYTFFLPNR